MRKLALLTILIASASNLLLADFSFSGVNEFKYIYANRILEQRSYFSDKLQFQMQFNQFRAGIKYDFYRPRFDKFALLTEKNENYFDEYYLQYESDHWFAQAGTFSAVIGTGMVLHNFYDEDFENDSRLIGGYLNPVYDKWQLQLFGGLMESDDPNLKDEYDQVGAFDSKIYLTDELSFGGSYVMHRERLYNEDSDFNDRRVYAGKLNYSSSFFDLKAEYAASKDDDDLEGTAIYSNITSYLGKITLIGAYKNYENFNVRISDLPVANHSGQQLEHSWDPGRDEEGLMGEVRYLPNYENEFVINYAGGWNSNFKVKQSDFYSEYKHDFESWSIKAEYAALEQLNKENANSWYKEITPNLTFDFMLKDNPILVKTEYQYKEEDKLSGSQSHFEPRLQTDIAFGNYSFSLTVENQLGKSDAPEDGDDGEYWIGGEMAITISSEFNLIGGITGKIISSFLQNSDIRIFAGKEKGGIVCRNGVCKNQAEFEGVRLNITTTF
ncbi:MAG: DUF6029 family protein [Candidatus Cloacimonadales bacterium]|nr:DUF6029 family protein [Candidatus Cloacimonadales bacterium]